MKNTTKRLTIFVLVLAIASLGSIARAADLSIRPEIKRLNNATYCA